MILSRGRRYIFVHIPKTGGTALALALEARAKADDILIGDTPKAVRRRGRLNEVQTAGRLWKHATLADIEGLVTRDELEDFLIFTLVRNPWDRMVSYYQWLKAQDFDHPAVALARDLSFADFVRHPQTVAAFKANPNGSYLRDGSGVERAGHFVRIERFEQDFAPVAAHLGFDLVLDRVNVSARARDWRGYYDADLAAHVGDICAEDVARFGYRFEEGAHG